jgi:hypothetical protein
MGIAQRVALLPEGKHRSASCTRASTPRCGPDHCFTALADSAAVDVVDDEAGAGGLERCARAARCGQRPGVADDVVLVSDVVEAKH